MKYYEDYPRHDLQIKESIRQTQRAANQEDYDDQLSLPARIIYLVSLIALMSGWMLLFFRALDYLP